MQLPYPRFSCTYDALRASTFSRRSTASRSASLSSLACSSSIDVERSAPLCARTPDRRVPATPTTATTRALVEGDIEGR
ncbi:hypothetical protein [Streptomyces sp. V2]|uniref:hypothetical protein n=1 Tax=Streptomyces sp. V2 TaxID=1424099 RepID=UPI001F0CA1AB|nr:hypothetical protein [Streptomyces sp. V2]